MSTRRRRSPRSAGFGVRSSTSNGVPGLRRCRELHCAQPLALREDEVPLHGCEGLEGHVHVLHKLDGEPDEADEVRQADVLPVAGEVRVQCVFLDAELPHEDREVSIVLAQGHCAERVRERRCIAITAATQRAPSDTSSSSR